jgi:hypothetical protein
MRIERRNDDRISCGHARSFVYQIGRCISWRSYRSRRWCWPERPPAPRLGLNFGFAGNRDVGGHRGDHIVRVGAPRATTGDPARRRRGIPDPEERIIAVGRTQNLRRRLSPGAGRAICRLIESKSEANRRDEKCSHSRAHKESSRPAHR